MDIIQAAIGLVPAPIRRSLRETPAESAVRHLRKRRIPLSTITPRTPSGPISLRSPTDSILTELVEEHGVYEPTLTAAIHDSVDGSSVLYDVGARFGYYSTLAVASGIRPENVHCFEAEIEAHHVLSRNHRHDGVRTNRTYVAAEPGRGRVTVDEYAVRHAPPTVVKIDTEGAERDVIRGMETCLSTVKPTLFVEMHPHLGVSASSVFDRLRNHGYALSAFVDHHLTGDAMGTFDGWDRIHGGWRPVSDAPLPTDRTFLIRASPESTTG